MIEMFLIWVAMAAGLVVAAWVIERLQKPALDPYECRHVHGLRCPECGCTPYATADVYMILVAEYGREGAE